MAAEGRQLGVAQSDLDHKMAKEADDSINKLMSAFDGLGRTIGAAVTPVVLPLIDAFTNWIKVNHDLISTKINTFFKSIGEEIKNIDWEKIGSQITNLIDNIGGFIENIGGWKVAIVGLIAIMNLGLIGSLLNVAEKFIKLSVLLAENPIALAVIAIAGAVYLIYKNWDGIVAYFEDKIDKVKQAFKVGFFDGISAILTQFDPTKILADSINGAVKYLFGIDLGAIGSKWIQGFIDAVTGKLSSMFDGIKQSVANIFDWSVSVPAAAPNGGHGRVRGFAPLPPVSPSTLALASGGGAALGAPAGGQIGVIVDFRNMPRGVNATAQTSGPAIGHVEVGKSRQGAL